MGRAICCVDGSDGAGAAVRFARRLADALGLELLLLNVQPATQAPGVSAAPGARERLREAELRDAEELLAAVAREEGLGPVATRAEIAAGGVAGRILEVCEEEGAELVVLGSRGRAGLKAALLGSVSAEVAAGSPCPCVIVPPAAAVDPDGR